MIFGIVFFVLILFSIAVYIYSCWALYSLSKRMGYKIPWLSWIPIANYFVLPALARMHWWPIAVFFGGYLFYIIAYTFYIVSFNLIMNAAVPIWMMVVGIGSLVVYLSCAILFYVYSVIWMYKICELRNRQGWWAILTIVPIFGWIWLFVLLGILAWSKN